MMAEGKNKESYINFIILQIRIVQTFKVFNAVHKVFTNNLKLTHFVSELQLHFPHQLRRTRQIAFLPLSDPRVFGVVNVPLVAL